MRIVSKNFELGKNGSCKMVPEVTEDFWHLYNLLTVEDIVTSVTFRKLKGNDSGVGGRSKGPGKTKRVKIGVKVEMIEFDQETCSVRVRGRNLTENPWIPLGSYHTLELAKDRQFEIEKEEWDAMHIERIETAADPSRDADVAAVVMQSNGTANLCLIGNHMTTRKEKIDLNIPKKRVGSTTRHDKSVARFFEAIMASILKHIQFKVVKCIILASPGFVKDDFFRFLMDEAQRRDLRDIIENKSKFLLCHSSSGHMHAIKEILEDPAVTVRLADTKAAGEVKVLQNFYDTMKVDESRAVYGWLHVHAASEMQAIKDLLITDSLFRCSDYQDRKRYVGFVDKVRDAGGNVFIFSVAHPSGAELTQLTGIAAILRFPAPEILELEEEVEGEEDSSS